LHPRKDVGGSADLDGRGFFDTLLASSIPAFEFQRCLALGKDSLDFDNLVVGFIGKGGKHRLVPLCRTAKKSLEVLHCFGAREK
jgi:site-specific recombinase XerD